MYAIILAGGIGARLWPMSRELYPKQFLKFNGEHTLLQETFLRVEKNIPFENIVVVAGNEHCLNIRFQAEQVSGKNKVAVLSEPAGRNTAPAIARGLFYLMGKGINDEVVVVLPSDHVIEDTEKFSRLLSEGEKAARKGYLVTFGILPDRPETGYGYIKKNSNLISEGVYQVDRFVEKPDFARAQSYLEQGGYYWNSGIFMFHMSTILEEYQKNLPQIMRSMETISPDEGNLKEVYESFESISIDYGILENSDRVAVIPADINWNDIGSWYYLYQYLPKDELGNALQGEVVNVDGKNNLVISPDKLTAVIGLENMVVINTDDALLICPQDRSQDVKQVVDMLKEKNAEQCQVHTTVETPWGNHTLLDKGPGYRIKRVVVQPGQKLSMQMHHHRSEHWVVVKGTARVDNGDKSFFLHVNESTYIPMSTRHRLENPGKVPLELIEVQNGQYIAEDDIVQIGDAHEKARVKLL